MLACVRWESDFFIFANTSMDTLDYTSGKINQGSKAILMGLGEATRDLPREFQGQLPKGIRRAEVFCAGCLVVEGSPYTEETNQAARLAGQEVFAEWPLVILHDDASVARSSPDFLWSTWTRFEPAADTYAAEMNVVKHHLSYRPPIVIDARKKPSLPDELVVRDDIKKLVDDRWREYFPDLRGLNH